MLELALLAMTKRDLSMQMLCRSSLRDPATSISLWRTLCEEAPTFLPERYGSWEPITSEFDCSHLDDVVWGNPMLWKRGRRLVEGSLWFEGPKKHGSMSISAASDAVDRSEAIHLTKTLGRVFAGDFGLLHLLTDAEVECGVRSQTVSFERKDRTGPFLLLTTHTLRKYLPDLYWGTIFGPSYTRLFGKDRIVSSPAAHVEELANETYYLQLTDDLFDVRDSNDEFDRVREDVKEHLGLEAFFREELGAASYLVPEFELQTSSGPTDAGASGTSSE